MKQIIQMKHNVQGEESQLVGGEPGGYFTSVAQDLNLELPKPVHLAVNAGLELRVSILQVLGHTIYPSCLLKLL